MQEERLYRSWPTKELLSLQNDLVKELKERIDSGKELYLFFIRKSDIFERVYGFRDKNGVEYMFHQSTLLETELSVRLDCTYFVDFDLIPGTNEISDIYSIDPFTPFSSSPLVWPPPTNKNNNNTSPHKSTTTTTKSGEEKQ